MSARSGYQQNEWSGINDNITDIAPANETSSYQIINASLLLLGECGRRLGIGAQIQDGGVVCAELATYVIFIDATGQIKSDAQ